MARNKYPEITVSKVLDVSTKLFTEKGYDNVTIQDIVDEMGGMTKGAIYHHFKGKEQIFEAIMDRLLASNNIFEQIKKQSGLNGLQKIQKVICMSMLEESHQAVNQIALPLFHTPNFLKKQLHDSIDKQAPYIEKFIEEGNRDGSLSVQYPRQAAETFMLLLNIWMNPGVFSNEQNDLKVRHLKLLFDNTGLPVLNAELTNQLIDFYHNLQL